MTPLEEMDFMKLIGEICILVVLIQISFLPLKRWSRDVTAWDRAKKKRIKEILNRSIN